MNDVKLTVDIDPEDKYQKAKKDLIQAKKSFLELTPQERQKLIYEFLNAEKAEQVLRTLHHFFG